jgi:hypothetical protein
MGRVLEDGHVLHADNPNPTFFDISHVFRPADRIAYISGQLKAAAAGHCVSGAELAEEWGVTAPMLFDAAGLKKHAQLQVVALQDLVAAESVNNAQDWVKVALAADAAVQPPIAVNPGESVKLAEALRGLADAGVILPVRDFLALTIKTAHEQLVQSVVSALPNIFSKLARENEITAKLETNTYWPAAAASPQVRLWAEKIAQTHSVLNKQIEKRAYLAAIRQVNPTTFPCEKQASSGAAAALAEHYALYKIAAFAAVCEKYGKNLLTANHCVLQNYIM